MPKYFPFLTAAILVACVAVALSQEVTPAEKPEAPATPPVVEKPAVEKKPAEKKPAEHAADPKPHAASAAADAAPEATPTPKPKKLSFFQRLFGSRKPRATPMPVITPIPVTTARKSGRKPATTPAPEARPGTPKPSKPLTLFKKTDSPEKTAPEVAPSATPPKKVVTAPRTPAPKTAKTPVEPSSDADADAKEKYRFEVAKTKAFEDPHIKGLKAKADDAATDEESRKALRAYNKALFEKIRKIDGSVSERANRMEATILKRLSE